MYICCLYNGSSVSVKEESYVIMKYDVVWVQSEGKSSTV